MRGGAGTLQQLLALAASGRVRTKLSRRRPVNNLCYQYVYVRDINCRISTAADACETSSATFCEDNCVRSGLVANLASRRRSTRVHSEKRRPPPKTSTYACVWNYTPVESHSLLIIIIVYCAIKGSTNTHTNTRMQKNRAVQIV